ncbi:MAG: sensor histidine kinase [Fimbriiglobus sp.]
MVSIQRSLIAYFLMLMVLTLAAVGYFVDRLVTGVMQSREEAESERLKQLYELQCKETRENFDKELTIHVQSMSRELRKEYSTRFAPNVARMEELTQKVNLALAIRAVGFTEHPLASLTNSFSLGTTRTREALSNSLTSRMYVYDFTQEFAKRIVDDPDHLDYFQIHAPRMPVVTSPKQSFLLPFDAALVDRDPQAVDGYLQHSDIKTSDGLVLRRVVYRDPVLRFPAGVPRGPTRPRETRPGTPPAAAPPPPPAERAPYFLSVYIQYARSVTELDAKLEEHRTRYDNDLRQLNLETQGERVRVFGLVLISGVVLLIALPTGSWFIVRRGLRPLKTFSDAVSQVSERDFRLPIHPSQLTTELAPIHNRLTETLDSLKRAFEREKQAVGDISHELRTPLASLRTMIDVSLRKPREAEQYRTTLDECREVSRQLSRLVDRILTLASLDVGQVQQSRVPIDVSDLASECVAVIRPLAESHGLRFTADLEPDVMASTDPDKVREVMMNLLHNAIEYNKTGGSITLKVRRATPGFQIEVEDTGIGMTPDVQAQIFQRFFRADPSRHATGVHAGLGLAIVKEYIDRMQGKIEVRSQPEAGTKFLVSLPNISA